MGNPFKDATEGLRKNQHCYRFTVTIVLREEDLDHRFLSEMAEEVRGFGSFEVDDVDKVGANHPDHLDS